MFTLFLSDRPRSNSLLEPCENGMQLLQRAQGYFGLKGLFRSLRSGTVACVDLQQRTH